VIEAALGALFLQHGFAAIEDAVVAAFSDQIERALTSRVDHKTDLQELLARTSRQVTYAEISVEGPPHERRFTCAAVIDDEELGRGEGRTKKDAEQEAAREALTKLDSAGDS
jgi:ribonuclease-3